MSLLPKQELQPSPEQRAANIIDERLIALAQKCRSVIVPLDMARDTFYSPSDVSDALWSEYSDSKAQWWKNAEARLRDFAGEQLQQQDANHLSDVASQLSSTADPIERAHLVLSALSERDREQARGKTVPAAIDDMAEDVRTVAKHHGRDIAGDADTIMRALQGIMQQAFAANQEGVRMGERFGWDNVYPLLSEQARWDSLRAFMSNLATEYDEFSDPGDPPATATSTSE